MDYLEVIKLSNRSDLYGSIALSPKYTPLVDLFLEEHTSENDSNSNSEGCIPSNNYGEIYWFDGQTISKSKWILFRTLQIYKKQDDRYYLITGSHGGKLIESFLEQVFSYCFRNDNEMYLQNAFDIGKGGRWNPHFVQYKQLNYTDPLSRAAQAIVGHFIRNTKYSLMVFNAPTPIKKSLPIYIQFILSSLYHRAGHIWTDIDLSVGKFNTSYEVFSEVSMNLPSIATYSNILEAYQVALKGDVQMVNKQTLNIIFDKIGSDTRGAISLIYCDCADKEALDALRRSYNTKDIDIQSFYRAGRIDGELTFNLPQSIHLYDNITEDTIMINATALL